MREKCIRRTRVYLHILLKVRTQTENILFEDFRDPVPSAREFYMCYIYTIYIFISIRDNSHTQHIFFLPLLRLIYFRKVLLDCEFVSSHINTAEELIIICVELECVNSRIISYK